MNKDTYEYHIGELRRLKREPEPEPEPSLFANIIYVICSLDMLFKNEFNNNLQKLVSRTRGSFRRQLCDPFDFLLMRA